MELYNALIEQIQKELPGGKVYLYDPSECCPKADKGAVILSKETAYELGAAPHSACSGTLFCTDDTLTDSVVIIGKDLQEITADTDYARFSLISLGEEPELETDDAYKQLKDIELSRYRVYPEGCMLRISPESRREQLRVSKKSLGSGLSLKNIGFSFIEEIKKNPLVRSVRIIFVTGSDFDYKKLSSICTKADTLTQSLNKIMDGLEISCESCSLKSICDEIEGLRELHFGKEKKQ